MANYETEYLVGDEKLLAEIRQRFDYAQDQWQDIRREAGVDMKYVSGNPWPQAEKKRREETGRPSLVMDELNQYTNQLINDIRQNKRAVRVVPRGYGANDKTAELRGDLIREIEYKSNAQAAYACAFENMCNRSYGGWIIRSRYINERSFDQELKICRIPNPDSSYPDPDCKEQDFSDARYWFLLDLIPRSEYKRKYPKAKIQDFTGEHLRLAPNWIKEDQIQVAEYWCVETKKRKLLQVKGPDGRPLAMFKDELPEGIAEDDILNEREACERSVVQYITNGVEILEENEWAGSYIPIVWLVGKELYVDEGSGPKRMLMSLVRLARDPQMLVNYYRTCEAEVVGMTPKTPYIGYTGQFHNPATWQSSINTPVAFLEADAKTAATGESILPPPMRQPYTPQVEPLEIGAESARRAIQAAMGLSALPTNAQRLNDKSGVALKQIDQNEDRGTFHFIDNYEMALEHSGRILNDLIKHIYDGAREVGMRNVKDEHRIEKINQHHTNKDGESVFHDMTAGEHEVTLSTGPSDQSERDMADKFVETMVPELEALPLDPTVKAKLLALLIKMRNVGPIGDEMVALLNPPDRMQNALQQATAQAQQYQQMVAVLQTENQKLYQEKMGKMVDNAAMLKKAQMDNLVKLALGEIAAKTNIASERQQQLHDAMQAIVANAHDAAMAAIEQQHQKDLAASAAANQQQLAAQQPSSNGNGA